MKEYNVYVDKKRNIISCLVYTLFVVGLTTLLCYKAIPFPMQIFIIIICMMFFFVIFLNIKKMIENKALYKISNEGVWDYTKKEDVLFLGWDEIFKIEMIPNNTSLQIGIMAKKTLSVQEDMSKRMKDNLMENGNMVFYSVLIDGFNYSKKNFQDIFSNLKQNASIHNNKIVINEYEDPILKRKKTNK